MKSNKPARQELAGNERIIPPHAPGMRIGLFGGTFDPPHQAHLDATLLAMKRLKLDRVWWLVTPGNPLKNTSRLSPLDLRMAAARKLTNHPRIDVTGLEASINTRYTYDTISWLIARCPRVQFVWIMGADNLRHFHRWQKWRNIAEQIPIVVVDRPGPSLYASNGPAGQALSRFRIPENAAASLPGRRPPVWTFLHGLKSGLSSTALRAMRGKLGQIAKPVEPVKAAQPEEKTAQSPAKRTVKNTAKKPSKNTAENTRTRTRKKTAKKSTRKSVKKSASARAGRSRSKSSSKSKRKAGKKRTK